MQIIKLLRSLPFVANYINAKSLRLFKLHQQNRSHILSLYRYFYKTLPQLYVRQIQKVNKLQQLRFIFKQSKPLTNPDQIKMKIQFADKIKDKIATNQWKGLPEFESATFDSAVTSLDNVINRQLTINDILRHRFRLKW